MKRFAISLAIVSLLSGGSVFGQRIQLPNNTGGNPYATGGNMQSDERQREIAEDLEILATIARENVADAYRRAHQIAAGQGGQPKMTSWAAPQPHAFALPEPLAEYLPGHGVIIQMRVLPPRPSQLGSADESTSSPPLSRWERTRLELRGEPPSAAWHARCAECHDTSSLWHTDDYYHLYQNFIWHEIFSNRKALDNWIHSSLQLQPHRPTRTDLVHALIETLAENGHHLRGLSPQERITISLSYWQSDEAAAAAGGARESTETDGEQSDADAGDTPSEQPGPSGGGAEASSGQLNPIDRLVQKKLDQALNAADPPLLRRAYLDLLGRLPTDEEVDAYLQDDTQGAYQRLVQRLTVRGIYGDNSAAGDSAAARPAPRLPARGRISVSATAAQCGQVARQELPPVEFAQQVQVRVFDQRDRPVATGGGVK